MNSRADTDLILNLFYTLDIHIIHISYIYIYDLSTLIGGLLVMIINEINEMP